MPKGIRSAKDRGRYEVLVRADLTVAMRVAQVVEGHGEVVFVRPYDPNRGRTEKVENPAPRAIETKPVSSPKDEGKDSPRFAHGLWKKPIRADDLIIKLLREKGRPMKTHEFTTPFIQNKFAGGSITASLSLAHKKGLIRMLEKGVWALVGETTIKLGAAHGNATD